MRPRTGAKAARRAVRPAHGNHFELWPLPAPVRLLLANPYFLPYHGGIEGRLAGMARELARDHEVAVLTARLPGTLLEERRDGYTILRQPSTVMSWFPYNPPPVFTPHVFDAIQGFDPDIVDFHYRWAPSWTRAFDSWSRRAPAVFTWHNPFGEGEGWLQTISEMHDRRFLQKLGSARRIICISEFVAQGLVANGVAPERLVIIYTGFDPPAPAAVVERQPFALFVGRLVETKGLDVLIDALKDFRGGPVIIVGQGPARRRLERYAVLRGVRGRLSFVGQVPNEERDRLLATARMVVHPARWEGLCHALAEALLHETPVVATTAGGTPEVVGPGGILVPPNDPARLAEAMNALWGNENLRKELAVRGRAHVSKFEWAACLKNTLRIYREAIEGNP